jgi:site-specific DNA recombinase
MLVCMTKGAPTRSVATAPADVRAGYVALYCRISYDRSGRVEGVNAQERWGRAYAAKMWPGVPIRAFTDNHLSASDEGVVRPGYEELRAAINRGEVAFLWAVEQTRLERREAPWFVFAAELEAAGIDYLHTNRDGIVSVRSEVAGIKAVLAAAETRRLKRRINDMLQAKAERGQPSGARPFGYRHGRLPNGEKTYVVVEDQAAIIRECADRVLSGWSLTAILTDLTTRGLHGPHQMKLRDAAGEIVTEDGRPVSEGGIPLRRPGKLTIRSVRLWLTGPAVAGLRVYRGEIVGPGNWPPILEEKTWQALRAKLSAPRAVQGRDGETYDVTASHVTQRFTGRRYLLTGGIAVCGICGASLVAQANNRNGGKSSPPAYKCSKLLGGRGCVTTVAEPFEAYVVKTLLDALDRDEFWAAFTTDEHTQRREDLTAMLNDIELQRSQLAREWAARKLTMIEWRDARDALAIHERGVRVDLASVPSPVVGIDRSSIRTGWEAMNLDERREIISMFIGTIAVVKPPYRGIPRFDPVRIAPPDTWWRHA